MTTDPLFEEKFAPFEAKMRAEGLSGAAIAAFRHGLGALSGGGGGAGFLAENALAPAPALAELAAIRAQRRNEGKSFDPQLLAQTVVLKLNGGLGTSMGLDKAKSLLEVKNGDTFLDLTAKQVIAMRKHHKVNVAFMLMNSFNTSKDTLSFLSKYSNDLDLTQIELMQNKVPKVLKSDLSPAEWPINRNLEWCPPGHGDLYTALYGSGKLDSMIDAGLKYMFVSNSDNLGATLDIDLLSHFAESGSPFLMECCRRTEADKKGGHLALRLADNRLVLRESAQCSKEDEASFQDIQRHQYFNTNNLWVRLDLLRDLMRSTGGFVPLPTILNAKTVDPQQDSSPAVYQLETAMGAAIECFDGAGAVCVPRERFAPVKKCSDLLLLRSDAYVVDEQYVLVLNKAIASGKAPLVELDDKKYKLVQNLEAATRGGFPSLVNCKKFSVKGEVYLSSRNVIRGEVSVVNGSAEPKALKAGVYENQSVDLSTSAGLGCLRPSVINTQPYKDQKPGTSGLRKKTKVFEKAHYLDNFVQSTFTALKQSGVDLQSGSLLVGGDGRYLNDWAIQRIIKLAAGNGVRRVVIGHKGLLSTPAVSAIIRERGPQWQKSFGAFILTASHNPGGPEEDFGIKYNCENGGPAPERLTELIYETSLTVTSLRSCEALPNIDIDIIGNTSFVSDCGNSRFSVEVIDSAAHHVELLKSVFDFAAIRRLLQRPDFTFRYDCMHGVQGPYARKVFVDELGCRAEDVLMNAVPLDDFGGGHADPNLTYARALCDALGVDATGQPLPLKEGQTESDIPVFGAACDGDADRNMILGRRFFVTPSDSLAILTAHADIIPFFKDQGGIKSVARSMPTSGAVDLVAKKMNLHLFETPTGWKFFGNVMDSKALFDGFDYTPMICGEESFGTGSDHVREKDGMWAVLAWLSILAYYNNGSADEPLVHVEDIVRRHWAEYGRNFYSRYDYEGVDSAKANQVMNHIRSQLSSLPGQTLVPGYTVGSADEFTYADPIDGSVSRQQGLRLLFSDGSRIIYRLSGTAGSGATIRVYLEQYASAATGAINTHTASALQTLASIALNVSNLEALTGFASPTVIT